jgi:hypothetical protein
MGLPAATTIISPLWAKPCLRTVSQANALISSSVPIGGTSTE